MTKVGFTGTQSGLTGSQSNSLKKLLSRCLSGDELHHGDCIGADARVHTMAQDEGYRVVVHPPTNGSKRAYCVGDELRESRDYLVRNHDIVDETDILYATPGGPEKLRSGTWATVRYARKLKRPIVVVWPDGSTTEE